MPLPTFLVIGAQKCGTSSLHEYLAQHPEIEMPASEKELDFFLSPEHGTGGRGRRWYEEQWTGVTEIRGEASPNYTAHPFHDGVPGRAAALVPEARLIYLVRDPIERIVSHYVHRRAHNLERRPLAQVLEDLEDPLNGLVQRSRYMMQIDRWLEHFEPSKVLVVVSERLRTRQPETLDVVFSFLGAAPGFRHDAFRAEHNTAIERRELTRSGLLLERARLARAARSLLPAGIREPLVRRLRSGLSEPVEVPSMPPSLRERIAEVLAPDVARLRAFTGDDLGEWSL